MIISRVVPLAVLLTAVVHAGVSTHASDAAETAAECEYHRDEASVDHARAYFSRLEYECSLRELLDFLKGDSIRDEQRAEAYRLLSAVHYSLGYDEDDPVVAKALELLSKVETTAELFSYVQ